jgi:alcohol dehydrogenase
LAGRHAESRSHRVIDGLRYNGELLVVAAVPEAIEVGPFQVVGSSKTLHGHPSGTAKDTEETLKFAALSGITPMTEEHPLEEINEGYQRMLSGDAEFRVVLTTGK